MHTPMLERDHPAGLGGVQRIYRFDNDLGASVVRFPYSYGGDSGLWELGVIKFNGDRWKLTYETPITSDVLGYLTDEEVASTLDQIAAIAKAQG
jgi:hypothetical protein